ncbi:MAG: phytase, partial [Sphingobacteriaceae bacterium]
MNKSSLLFNVFLASALLITSCGAGLQRVDTSLAEVKPTIITEPVQFDSDDPAIWINPQNPAKSLIIGTDKNEQGALYVFDLDGKIIQNKVVRNLKRPNNVDLIYGLMLHGKPTDIAVTTERMTHKLRMFSLPDMKPVDNGGLEVFSGETGPEYRDLMGIAIYTAKNGNKYAVVGRKNGP